MSSRPSDRPSDRPDHPPVWVRGGPPYYYIPTRPSISTSPSETLRRASTTSTLSSSHESTGETISPPPSPEASPVQPSGLRPPFPFPSFGSSPLTHQTSPPLRPPYMAQQPPHISVSGSGSKTEDEGSLRPNAFRRRNSVSGTNLFSNLASQKRNTADTSFALRRAQWHEQNVGAGPEKRRFFSSWWDNYVRGIEPNKK
ncbi:hypothetical protein I7I51_04369 [Histoplasma capsulatum]|uniref:Uncharacterized protein n=1 Tax=Ajellomyces capsulatus TaxID=5037 RepID=A0A8A1MCF9_AJECA|nr:predicted protein [Histoplasma mississippiense (nom. inval.)]EDN07720.1 predicted protein [Histoplasma mississippiense (nom. inval.)]QSS62192.1 hypothetical protein I7I51_04369 [Histoplasma capsulatum]